MISDCWHAAHQAAWFQDSTLTRPVHLSRLSVAERAPVNRRLTTLFMIPPPYERCAALGEDRPLRWGAFGRPAVAAIDPEMFRTKPPERLGPPNIHPFRQFPPRPLLSWIASAVCSVCRTRHADTRLALTSDRPLVSPVINVDIFCNTRRKRAFL